MIASGARVRALEGEVAALSGEAGGVAASCGTAALVLALRAMSLPVQSEVILPTYVCREVYAAVVAAGLTPVLCDVALDGLMSAETVAARLSARTSAVIVVHLFGRIANTATIEALGFPVVEDACQAFGVLGSERSQTASMVRVFSFHATKCLTTGEGGMAVSRDAHLLSLMRQLRDAAIAGRGRIATPMSDLQAELGLSQLRNYPAMLARRRAIAAIYIDALRDCPVAVEPMQSINRGAAFRFVLRSELPFPAAERAFAGEGITVRRGVDALLHRSVTEDAAGFPIAELLFAESISVPIYPALSDEDVEHISRVLPVIFGGGA
jgi:perosamine synthetase